jgi:hypothetical protein
MHDGSDFCQRWRKLMKAAAALALLDLLRAFECQPGDVAKVGRWLNTRGSLEKR